MRTCLKNNRGFNIIELMIVTFVLVAIIGGSFSLLQSGQSAWFTAEANMTLEDSLRQAINRVVAELSESGEDENGVMQVDIANGTGVGGSDIIKFSIPVVCQNNVSVMDASGDVAYWRAPLTWGCTASTCMDADNDCGTVDYKFIEYRLLAGNLLARRVLDAADAEVRQDVIARNISDFQAAFSVDQKVVTVTLAAQTTSAMNRDMTASKDINVRLRNKR